MGLLTTMISPLVIVLGLIWSSTVNALPIEYCSSLNTGSSYSVFYKQFQSNGACHDNCLGDYAFAILQGPNCWCSNYAPGQTTSVSSCNEQCPGYGIETCGSEADNLFAYISLGNPSGTVGLPSTNDPATVSIPPFDGQPSPTPELSVSVQISTVFVQPTFASSSLKALPSPTLTSVIAPSPVTVLETVTASASASASVKVSTVSIIPPSSSTTTPTPIIIVGSIIDSPTSTWTPSPFASVITVTGLVQTVTITPSAPPAASVTIQAAQIIPPNGFFADTGKVVGVFVGAAIAIVTLAFLIIWCTCCRRRTKDSMTIGSNPGDNGVSRRSSRLSTLGFAVKRRSGDWAKDLPTLSTAGLNNGSGNEKSPLDTTSPVSRRTSGHMRVVDQRLDPDTLWNQEHGSGSHVSIRSFRDDRDYSRRMLRVANPDDEVEII